MSRKQMGAGNSNWKGGKHVDKHGRVALYRPRHPFPSVFKRHVYRYRLKMEKKLGRYLRPDEIVHHIDGDCTNDRITNLQVMTQAEHAKIHMMEMWKEKLNGRWSMGHDKCIVCGTTEIKHEAKGKCVRCYGRKK